MRVTPSATTDQPLDLGPDGEVQFDRLRASIEYGQGFELFLCGFESGVALAEVRRRLANEPPPGHVFELLPLEGPGALSTMAERLAATGSAAAGRKIVFAGPWGWEEDVKAEWAVALQRLNERRNLTIHECPNVIVLAGPSWFPWLVYDRAPDLWSVRIAVFTFPGLPAGRDDLPAWSDLWPSGLPMAHELQPPEYYEELAEALETSRRSGEQETRGRLLIKAVAAWELRGEYDSALHAATKAKEAFTGAEEELMVAVAKEWMALILVDRGETEDALRILREEVLPEYERLGDVRSHAIAMGKIADILDGRGETEEALRILREELLPVFEQLDDVRSRAVTASNIADILQRRGEIEDALRIRSEEVLPEYERLGDVRARAVP